MECDYTSCPITREVADIKERLLTGSKRFEELYTKHGELKDEFNTIKITLVENNMKSEERHKDLKNVFQTHTLEEMEVHKHTIETLSSLNSKITPLLNNNWKSKVMWGVFIFLATGVGGYAFYLIQKITDILLGTN